MIEPSPSALRALRSFADVGRTSSKRELWQRRWSRRERIGDRSSDRHSPSELFAWRRDADSKALLPVSRSAGTCGVSATKALLRSLQQALRMQGT